MTDVFSDEDRRRIEEAVGAAERRTSGEIVPFIVRSSDDYEVAVWKGGGMAAGLALLVAMLIFHFYEGWGMAWLHTGWGTASVTLAAGIAGGLLGAFVPPLRRVLAGRDTMTRAVHRRAMKAFVEEEIFDTEERTGILIFISMLEHRIEVLGDGGIHEKVSPDDWADVVARLRTGIRSGRITDGIVDAVGMCGDLLERSGVALRSDDPNELPDELRTQGGP